MGLDEEAPWWLARKFETIVCRGRFASDERASNDDELRCQHLEILEYHQRKAYHASSEPSAADLVFSLRPVTLQPQNDLA